MIPWTRALVVLLLAAIGLAALLAFAGHARAEGYDLTGRVAPDMAFTDGLNGVTRGTTLSSFRGRPVWVMFILRDCPRCKRVLPRAQELHERWGGSGLVVLVVVHEMGGAAMQGFMREGGYTFRLGTDAHGALARSYGVRHRPTSYVVGIDGRVKASNGAPDAILKTELGRYRLARLGKVPGELPGVREAVWKWDYGTALRQAEPVAAADGASVALKAFVTNLQAQARAELDARVALARRYARTGRTDAARAILDRLVQHFEGTSLSTVAKAARAQRP